MGPGERAGLACLDEGCGHKAREEQAWWIGGAYKLAQKLLPNSSCSSRCSSKSSLSSNVIHHDMIFKCMFSFFCL